MSRSILTVCSSLFFVAQSSGGVEGLETTIRDPTLQSVTAIVTFRDLSKTAVLSNDLRVNLNLAEEATALHVLMVILSEGIP